MSYKIKTKTLNIKTKALPFIVMAALILMNTGIANAQSNVSKKPKSSRTLRSMARVYMAYGQYEKAAPLAEKALSVSKRTNASETEIAMCMIDLATVYKNQGYLLRAEQLCLNGFDLQEKNLYNNHPYLAYTLSNLSSIYYDQGQHDKALTVLDKAIAIMLDCHAENDKAIVPFFVEIAQNLTAQGKLSQAQSYYDKAVKSINSSYGPNHLYTANVLGGVAKLYILQGKYAQAETLINRTVKIQERVYGSDHYLVASSWLTKAKIYEVKGKNSESEKLINKALVAIEKTGNAAALLKLQQEAKVLRIAKAASIDLIASATR